MGALDVGPVTVVLTSPPAASTVCYLPSIVHSSPTVPRRLESATVHPDSQAMTVYNHVRLGNEPHQTQQLLMCARGSVWLSGSWKPSTGEGRQSLRVRRRMGRN
jgi:hypothetical protein